MLTLRCLMIPDNRSDSVYALSRADIAWSDWLNRKRGCRKTKNVILNGHACPVKNLKVLTFPLDYT